MNRFDPEIIAAFADGTLSPDEAAAVEARIAADPEARAEVALQRTALSAVRAAVPPRLSDEERGALRAAIAAELHLAPSAATAATPPRRVAWGALGVAAATLTALVLAVPIAGLLTTGGGGDDAAAITFAGDTTKIEAGEDARVGTAQGDVSPPSSLGPDDPLIGAAPDDPATVGALDVTTTTTTAALFETASGHTLAEDLLLIRSDPDALENLATPVEETTPCRDEARRLLGSDDLVYFTHAGEMVGAEGDGVPRDYVVYYVDADEDGWVGPLIAFPADDCTAPTEVP